MPEHRVVDGRARPVRPSGGWWILGLPADPTPGDPGAANLLAAQLYDVGHHQAADTLDALVKVLSEAQAGADDAYRRAHAALSAAGLTDEDLRDAAGLNASRYADGVRGILMTLQQERFPGSGMPSAIPRQPAADSGDGSHASLTGEYQQALDALIQGRAAATAAATAHSAAMNRCAQALEQAVDSRVVTAATVVATSVSSSGAKHGGFDQCVAAFGGNPAERHFSGAAFEAWEGARDGRAWQAAKANPTSPNSMAVLLQTRATLAAHRGDPDYFQAFADTGPDDVAAFQGLAAVDADLLNRFKLQEAVGRSDCPQALKDLKAGLYGGSSTGRSHPDVYLLGFDAKEGGHVALSFGNPDTAATITIYIPEPGRSLSDVHGDLARVQAYHMEALPDPDGSHASVYWLGHPAPKRFWPAEEPAIDAYSRKFPSAGGPQLAAFVNALNAQHHGPINVLISRLGRQG